MRERGRGSCRAIFLETAWREPRPPGLLTFQLLHRVIRLHESNQNQRKHEQDDRGDDEEFDEGKTVTFAGCHGGIWTAGTRGGLSSWFCRGAGAHRGKELGKLLISRIVFQRILQDLRSLRVFTAFCQ